MPITYTDICDRVWRMYEELRKVKTPRGEERRVLLPPPCRKERVDLLVVGMKPNNRAPILFGQSRKDAEEFARDFEYIRRPGSDPRLGYDIYYLPLLKLAQRVHPSFGTWWQVEKGGAKFLIEFSDFLHVAAEPSSNDFNTLINHGCDPSIPVQCSEILKMEIELYKPRAVLCNGRSASNAIFDLCNPGKTVPRPPETTCLSETPFGCSVHFMEFYRTKEYYRDGKGVIDEFSQQRIANEIRKCLFSRA